MIDVVDESAATDRQIAFANGRTAWLQCDRRRAAAVVVQRQQTRIGSWNVLAAGRAGKLQVMALVGHRAEAVGRCVVGDDRVLEEHFAALVRPDAATAARRNVLGKGAVDHREQTAVGDPCAHAVRNRNLVPGEGAVDHRCRAARVVDSVYVTGERAGGNQHRAAVEDTSALVICKSRTLYRQDAEIAKAMQVMSNRAVYEGQRAPVGDAARPGAGPTVDYAQVVDRDGRLFVDAEEGRHIVPVKSHGLPGGIERDAFRDDLERRDLDRAAASERQRVAVFRYAQRLIKLAFSAGVDDVHRGKDWNRRKSRQEDDA